MNLSLIVSIRTGKQNAIYYEAIYMFIIMSNCFKDTIKTM